MSPEIIAIIVLLILSAVAGIFILQKNKRLNKSFSNLTSKEQDLIKREASAKQRAYEIEILNELGDKADYSLSAQSVVEVFTKSLNEFIGYSTISYMLLYPEKIIFKIRAEKLVSRGFIDDVKTKMLNFLSATAGTDLKNAKVEETLWGTVSHEEPSDDSVDSFFNIPLVISGKFAGILTVADTKAGAYTEDEVSFLNKIAQQACQAVTRLKQAVEAENSKLNAMVASMTDGVIMTDTDYRITVVNSAAFKALGADSKKALSMADLARPLNGKVDLEDKIEEGIRLDKIFVSDEISLPTGFFKIVVSPVKDEYRTLGCVVILRDITHEKEVERIKEDFTAMIVHELRSPLDSVKKMIELMRSAPMKKAKQSDCFQMIYGSSSDMLELINNLLDIAKIEAGKFELMKQKSDIKSVIESRVAFFDIAAKDAKITIATCFGDGIPTDVEFDPHTISQVLNNLISNAIKFTKEGGTVTLQALFHKGGSSVEKEAETAKINWFIKKDIASIPDSLLVAVTDNGTGIAPDQIGKLFNKFIQAKSNFVSKGGTGLGLAITKSIIDSHGGVVGVESLEGQGTTFYFTLPISLINK